MERISTLEDLELSLGESIKALRLQKNIDRQTLCNMAGISMNALKHLETGTGARVKTLLLVIRALDRIEWLENLSPQISINPLHTVRNKPQRLRASRRPRTYGKNKKAKNS